MEYEAQFGKVKTGDYVIVVTNNYMRRYTTTTVGLVQDDGYVYCGNSGITRRKIGSDGCPICKIDGQLVPSDLKKHLKAYVESRNSKNQTDEPHYYTFSIVSKESAGDAIVNITTITDRVMKKKFSTKNNKSIEDQIKETIKRRYPIDDIYWRQYNPNEDESKIYRSITREVTIKEVTFDEYSKTKYSKVETTEVYR